MILNNLLSIVVFGWILFRKARRTLQRHVCIFLNRWFWSDRGYQLQKWSCCWSSFLLYKSNSCGRCWLRIDILVSYVRSMICLFRLISFGDWHAIHRIIIPETIVKRITLFVGFASVNSLLKHVFFLPLQIIKHGLSWKHVPIVIHDIHSNEYLNWILGWIKMVNHESRSKFGA